MATQVVFVYGTLRKGQPNRRVMAPYLVRELGIESELISSQPSNLGTYVIHRGKLIPLPHGANLGIPSSIGALWSTALLSPIGKARALMDLILPARVPIGDESLGDLLTRRFGTDLAYHLAEPLLAGIYAGRIDHLSVQATFPQFHRMEREHGSLLRAAMADARQREETGTSTGGRSAFVTLRSGLQTLVERLFDCLRDWADLRTCVEAVRMARHPDGTYAISVRSQDGTDTLTADAVLVTAPAFAAGALLAPLAPAAEALSDIYYASTATVILAYHAYQLPSRLAGAGFVIPFDENRAITACTWTSSKWPHTTPDPYAVLRCYVGRTGQEQHLALSDADMVASVRRELRDILGIEAAPAFSKVTRWQRAMPQYRVNHLQRLAEVEHELGVKAPGVAIAGAGYRGLGIPDCIAQATSAADRIFEYLRQKA
ncbi:MAG: protoporphyrinogen oxidase [Alicyclobacillus sp.]|nr:protoporphyrinogen oxidase [Alicyclobacillus sp.]